MGVFHGWLQFSFAVLSIVLTVEAANARTLTCSEVFSQFEWNRERAASFSQALYGRLGKYGSSALSVYDSTMVVYSSSGAYATQGVQGRVTQQAFEFVASKWTLGIEKVSFEAESQSAKARPSALYASEVERFAKFVEENESQRNVNARGRKRSWSTETVQQVIADLKSSADVSKLIFVKLKTPIDKIIGVCKFVSGGAKSLKPKLAFEDEFGLNLPENAGRKIEIANYNVDPKYNAEATLEIFIQVAGEAVQRAQDPGHVAGKSLFYVLADPVSSRIYQGMGFTKLKEVTDKRNGKWFVLEASAETVLAEFIGEMHAKRRFALDQTPERLAEVSKIFELRPAVSPFRFWKFEKIEHDSKQQERRLTLMITETLPGGSAVAPGVLQGPVRRLKIFDPAARDLALEIFLPEKMFPLTDGARESLYPNIEVEYKAGVLVVTRGNERFEITVDRFFEAPSRIWYVSPNLDVSARF